MNRSSIHIAAIVLGLLTSGCARPSSIAFNQPDSVQQYGQMATHIEYPDGASTSEELAAENLSPLTVRENSNPEYWDMKLEEATQIALSNSPVLRDLSGLVLRSPINARTIQGPAITELDPRFGVDAALSAFDASFSTSAFFEKNDRALNNTFFGGGTRELQQDVGVYQTQITKRTATGTSLVFRQNTAYDSNNAPGNRFASAWNVNFETEFRQPLLQGNGIAYNRIAGPGGIPGLPTGVLIARVNTDISLTDFEAGVHDFASNIENAYWDLYFAYRDLHAKIVARDTALETWRRIHALYETRRRGGEEDKEAEAREQYYRFQEDVQNAWNGRLVEGTRTNNGSSGGTFRATVGVRVAERRLRLLLGIPISDGRLIRPVDEPLTPRVVFDWETVMAEALARRVELRRQKWHVKRRELELIASRNYLLPQLDTVGRYRWRGFGHDLFGGGPLVAPPDPANPDGFRNFNSAVQDLSTLDFQEWQVGVEFSVPFGRRRGHAAVRNAQLQLARERSILREQEESVIHDLSNAIGEVNRAYEVTQTSYNRRLAARHQLRVTQSLYLEDKATLDNLLDAQRRLADDEVRYFGALVDYALAVKNVHFEKGSLLDYNEIYLAEGPWPGKAYDDAARRESLRRPPSSLLNYVLKRPRPVSQGVYPQQTLPQPDEMPGDLQPLNRQGPTDGLPGNQALPADDLPPPPPSARRQSVKPMEPGPSVRLERPAPTGPGPIGTSREPGDATPAAYRPPASYPTTGKASSPEIPTSTPVAPPTDATPQRLPTTK